MRVSKTIGLTNTTTTYANDGQVSFEDVDINSTSTTVTDYGFGARRIDYISSTPNSGDTVAFSVYDAHGNMTACLFRSGSGYTIGNERHYDAWGVIRNGGSSGEPKSLGTAVLGSELEVSLWLNDISSGED